MDYILSIETAFGGGSLAILSNREVVDEWQGQQAISKAEDVLEQISTLLERHDILKKNITTIIVSSGAGSATGEKIGQAIAKGLGQALNCRVLEVSTHESLLEGIDAAPNGKYLTAIPNGKSGYDYQVFTLHDSMKFIKDLEIKKDGVDELSLLKNSGTFQKVITPDDINTSKMREACKVVSFRSLAAINGKANLKLLATCV